MAQRPDKPKREESIDPATQKPYSRSKWRNLEETTKYKVTNRRPPASVIERVTHKRRITNTPSKAGGSRLPRGAIVTASRSLPRQLPLYLNADGSQADPKKFFSVMSPLDVVSPTADVIMTSLFDESKKFNEVESRFCDVVSFDEVMRPTSRGRIIGLNHIMQQVKSRWLRPNTHYVICGFTSDRTFTVTIPIRLGPSGETSIEVEVPRGVVVGWFPTGTMIASMSRSTVTAHVMLTNTWRNPTSIYGNPKNHPAAVPTSIFAIRTSLKVYPELNAIRLTTGGGLLRICTLAVNKFTQVEITDDEDREEEKASHGISFMRLINRDDRLAQKAENQIMNAELCSGKQDTMYRTDYRLEAPLTLQLANVAAGTVTVEWLQREVLFYLM